MSNESWLITGSTGFLGAAVSVAAKARGVSVVRTSLRGRGGAIAFDLRQTHLIPRFLDSLDPARIIHLAACARPTEVEERPRDAFNLNVLASQAIAEWCHAHRRGLVFSSSDQVFGGGAGGPYSDRETPSPTTAYGLTKVAGEAATIAASGLVARLGWLIGDMPCGGRDFLQRAIADLRQGRRVTAADDELRTPIQVSTAAAAIVDLAALGWTGHVNVAGDVHVTPYDLLMSSIPPGVDSTLIGRVSYRELAPPGRPGDVRLAIARLRSLAPRRPLRALAN